MSMAQNACQECRFLGLLINSDKSLQALVLLSRKRRPPKSAWPCLILLSHDGVKPLGQLRLVLDTRTQRSGSLVCSSGSGSIFLCAQSLRRRCSLIGKCILCSRQTGTLWHPGCCRLSRKATKQRRSTFCSFSFTWLWLHFNGDFRK